MGLKEIDWQSMEQLQGSLLHSIQNLTTQGFVNHQTHNGSRGSYELGIWCGPMYSTLIVHPHQAFQQS